MKTTERLAARRIRREEGASIKDIARRVGVSVSSVSLWVRDIELTPEQHRKLLLGNPAYNRQLAGWRANRRIASRRRRASQDEGRERARRADPFFLAGCMLFWAEGDKCRNAVRVTNSDPDLLRLFVRFLRECYGAPIERIAVNCNLFADHVERQREIEDFWLRTLELPRSCLRKSIVNVYSKYSQKKRKNKLPYGTCKVVYSDTRTVQSIYGAIQEYAGFDRPEWLG
jgi:transcriptional regulator with XRE-family HTH domain